MAEGASGDGSESFPFTSPRPAEDPKLSGSVSAPGSGGGGLSGGEWQLASPPPVSGIRGGKSDVFGNVGGVRTREEGGTGEGLGLEFDVCAEWVVPFSSSLDLGVTTVKVSNLFLILS